MRAGLAALLLAFVATFVGGSATAAPVASLVAHYRDGPVPIDGSALVTQTLPAGEWAILATALVLYDSVTAQGAGCTLTAGWDYDTVSVSNGRTARTIALAVVHHATAGFDAVLTCSHAPGAPADIASIRIHAYRLDRLTNRQLPSGEVGSWGTGGAEVIAGWNNGSITIPVGSTGTLATLRLPKGRWWVTAKLEVQAGGAKPSTVDCHVGLGSAALGYTRGPAGDQVGSSEISAVQMQHARRLTSAGQARVRCTTNRPATGAWLKVVAFRAGELVTDGAARELSTPTVRMVTRPGPVLVPAGTAFQKVASLRLPAGSWSILATATAANTSGSGRGYLACRIGKEVGATQVVDVDLGAGAPHRRTPVTMLALTSSDEAQVVRLRCRAGARPLRLSDIRIVARSAGIIQLSMPAEPAG